MVILVTDKCMQLDTITLTGETPRTPCDHTVHTNHLVVQYKVTTGNLGLVLCSGSVATSIPWGDIRSGLPRFSESEQRGLEPYASNDVHAVTGYCQDYYRPI